MVREQDFPVVSHPLAEAVVTIAIGQGQSPVLSNFGGGDVNSILRRRKIAEMSGKQWCSLLGFHCVLSES